MHSWVLLGNTVDASTAAQFRTDLRGWNLGRAMFVTDSGSYFKNNRTQLGFWSDSYRSHRA